MIISLCPATFYVYASSLRSTNHYPIKSRLFYWDWSKCSIIGLNRSKWPSLACSWSNFETEGVLSSGALTALQVAKAERSAAVAARRCAYSSAAVTAETSRTISFHLLLAPHMFMLLVIISVLRDSLVNILSRESRGTSSVVILVPKVPTL